MVAVPASEKDELRRVLDDDGTPLPGVRVPAIADAELTRIFEVMALTRIFDDRMMRLQRQGRLGFYMKSIGEEASHFAVAPLRASDWVFPSYREPGAWFWRGYTIQQYVDQLMGNEGDPIKGRQMPVHLSASWLHMVSVSSPVGTQIPQAVGAAYAARALGKDDVTLAFFGEGTTSTGEFHVGLNFAGVWKAPCVFVCRNNGWAVDPTGEDPRPAGRAVGVPPPRDTASPIDPTGEDPRPAGRAVGVPTPRDTASPIRVPSQVQTAARTFAAKARGYGMPGVRVDGNDLLAVWQVASDAIERARAGLGPTLIEALTYRGKGHSSSDDPSVYRDPGEPEVWERRDPLRRLRGYLRHRGLWSESWETELSEACHQQITDALAAADRKRAPAVETLFDDVYEQLPWHLREQRAYLLAQARTTNPHHRG